jgi:hypothetical protein
MSDPSKAVFLSYASQDADAARRIAEALRAAGVEVWFDETELRGGDAWDQKLRRQIKECALFVPFISANTQARGEGYFRLEWKLAVDRSHLMADDAPFLVPVVIDDTPDAVARVPEKFRERQWTRLSLKNTPESLARRIAAVLSGDGEPTESVSSVFRAPAAGARRRSEFPKWLTAVFILTGIGMGLFYTIWPMVKGGRESPPAPVAARAELSEADKLVEQATVILNGSALSREQIDTANDLLEEAIDRDPSNAAAWTGAARADLLLIYPYGYDESEERRQRAMSRATRAAFLAKDSFETKVVQANVMAHASGNPALTREAEEFFRNAVRDRPEDIQLQVGLGETLREQERF